MNHVQRWLAWAGSAALIFAVHDAADPRIAIAALVYLCFFNVVVYDLTRTRSGSIVQHMFLIFFSVGHVLKTAFVWINSDVHKAIGWNSVGAFDFTFPRMAELFLVQAVGLVAGYLVFARERRRGPAVRPAASLAGFRVEPYLAAIAWFFVTMLVIHGVRMLGFGVHGFAPDEGAALPFKLGGLLLYLRNVFIFGLGLVLLDLLVARSRRFDVAFLCVMYLAAALYYSYASLSRGAIIVVLLPIMYVWARNVGANFGFREFWKAAAVAAFLVLVATAINNLRVELYRSDDVQVTRTVTDFVEVASKLSFAEFAFFFDLLINRIEGSRELMGVVASDLASQRTFWSFFFGTDPTLSERISGFSLEVEGRAYGITYGLLGLLYLSNSLLIVFAGTALYMLGLLAIERWLQARGYLSASFFVTVTLFLNVWGNMTWFFLFRFVAVLALLYWTITRLVETRVLIRPGNEAAPANGPQPALGPG